DAETGQRGFLLTERQDYLDPYDRAMAQIPRLLARLKAAVQGNRSQIQRASELENAIQAKVGELQRTIDTARRGGIDEANKLLMTDEGKRLMDGIRRILQDMMVEEEALFDQRVLATQESERRTLYVTMGASLVALVLLLGAGLLLFRNNTKLRAAEADIARHAALLQSALDSTRDGIAAFDPSNKLVAYNKHFFSLLDFPEQLAHAGQAFDSFAAIDRDRHSGIFDQLAQRVQEAGASDAGRSIEVSFGGRSLECFRNQMPGGGYLFSCSDLTRRKQAEEAARQAQKNEAMGHLTGGVAHDFNNLLQVIRTNLDLLARDLKGDERQQARLRSAMAGTERGARLTGQLLAFARRQPLVPRATNLARLIGDMTELLRRTLGERVEVEAVVAGGLWNTMVDPTQVENAVLNLAINARDAMPEGGKLTIELANAFLDEAYAARHDEVQPGQYVMLAVTDTGHGMPPDVAARAFEPFFTTKREGEGTGLGLSQVYGFVKQSGGHVKLYSEIGQGTTIKLYLPRVRRPEELPVVETGEPAVGGDETVLVVEDDAGVRQAVSESLTDLGYHVLKAENAEAALAILSSGARIDLVFTDVVMPGPIKTRDLTRRAKELIPSVAVLYTSGYTENAIIHDGRLDDDVILLSKPYTQEELARRMRAALARVPAPVEKPAATATAAAAAANAAAPSDGARRLALVVEDDAIIRIGLVDMVRDAGFEVVDVGTAQAALKAIDAGAAVAVAILDLGLPDMPGADLAVALREKRAGLPIIVASGASQGDLMHGGRPMTRVFHLPKPYTAEQLAGVLSASLA
ncbi:MAG: CHASE3 domain-containing protein, partial [Rhodospirillales bacterium]|nr:CHASE3 domain-containing protein [Rhodospirillales bacterium]